MHFLDGAMRYEDEGDPKSPRPVGTRHKGENPPECEEHGPCEVDPDDRSQDGRYHHFHVRC